VTLLKWETFLDSMINRENHIELWSQLYPRQIAVIGGVDLTIDYMYVAWKPPNTMIDDLFILQ
jgi:hypothetical protein